MQEISVMWEMGFQITNGILTDYDDSPLEELFIELMESVCEFTINIPDSVITIGGSAFEGCERLTGIAIPDSVKTLGADAFHGCKGLADKDGFVMIRGTLYDYFGPGGDAVIPDNVTAIGHSSFKGCENLTGIAIPDTV